MDAIYISGNSFKVVEDKTAEFSSGRRVKLDCGLDGIKYASVVSSSYSSPYTTVTIDESDLTASLTDALYGVTQPGETGSFPDHTHEEGGEGQGGVLDGASLGLTFLSLPDTPTTYSETEGLFLRVDSTASGIEFTEAATSFLELTDTPKTYSGSEDLYLRVTTTGIDFSYLSTSGIDDHSHVAYVPWDFGAGTISGTGDIYCSDIYTSSGTVYLGDLKLSNVDGGLSVNDNPIEGTTWLEGAYVPDDLDDGLEGDYFNYLITKDVYKKRPEVIYNAWNPADKDPDYTLSNADLTATCTSGWSSIRSLISISSGKWYWEVYVNSGSQVMFGVGSSSVSLSNYLGAHAEGWGYNGTTGTKYNNGNSNSFGSTYGAGVTIGVALDMDSGKIWWSRNGVWQASGDPASGANPAFSNLAGVVVYPMASNQSGQITAHFGDTNFGALPFTYTVPEGFLPGVYNSSAGSWNLVGTFENTGSTTFSGLTDTPGTYDEGKFLRSKAAGTEWVTVSGSGGSDGWTYSTEHATTSGTIVTFDDIPPGVTSIEVMTAAVKTSTNTKPAIIQLGDAGGIETSGYDVSNELGSQTFHTTDGWHTVVDSLHLNTMPHYGCLKLRKFIPSQNLWLGEYAFMTAGGNNVRYGSGFKILDSELTSVALATVDGIATFTGGSATIRYK